MKIGINIHNDFYEFYEDVNSVFLDEENEVQRG